MQMMTRSRFSLLSLLTDIRVLQIIGQVIFLILVVLAISGLIDQIIAALASRNLTPNFTFLQNRAGFEIAGATNYSPNDSFAQAFLVGLGNTLSVVIIGLILTTILGILVGVFLLSRNWLVRTISRVFVEILRNTPLLVQIIIVFFFVLALPPSNASITIPQEGIALLPLRYAGYLVALLVGWQITRGLAAEDWRSALTFPLIISTIIRVELGFLMGADPLVVEIYAIPYLGAMVILAGLLIVMWRTPSARFALVGVLIGQGLGLILLNANLIPDAAARFELQPLFYLNNRGFYFPVLQTTARFGLWALFVVVGIVVATAIVIYFARLKADTGKDAPRLLYALLAVVGFALIGWIIVSAQPLPSSVVVNVDGAPALVPLERARSNGLLSPEDALLYAAEPLAASVPVPSGLRYNGGGSVSRGYVALLIALVIYTAAFIAEIVRAGILAVPRGQLEASRALGFTASQTLRMVILPQALRVIIPPLGNQYLNLSKNSSLAIAVAYPDIYAVMGTVINQSGQAVTGILVIMVSYLIISLIISALMNWVNRRFQIVTR
jgi:general L-amino acid transport system permease protein